VGGLTGKYVELTSPESSPSPTAIWGAIVTEGNRAWIFTLKGNADLAKRERENFRTFLKSIRFPGEDGADDGN
jgi:hypothetical protein